MHYLALASDYDGTLASSGVVLDSTLLALELLLASGRKLILVTGRELPDLLTVFPRASLCERIVAENGALLYRPATKEIRVLGPPPIPAFIDELRRRMVPLSVGHGIIATWSPHENVVLEVIRDLGLELRIIFNKGAVMILPTGINKASGLMAALDELALSPHNIVGIGDGENDHALLNFCEYGVAVENAIPMLKETADRTTIKDHGAGVVEIIEDLIKDDLKIAERKVSRHNVLLGTGETGENITLRPIRESLLIAGSSGGGKSTLATGVLERLGQNDYQCCVIDPEGDYENLPRAIVLGTAQGGPSIDEVMTALANPHNHVVINLVGLPLKERSSFFLGLLPRLQEMVAKVGRPHWTLVDEAHHLLAANSDPAAVTFAAKLACTIYVTVHPDQIAPPILESVDTVIAMGEKPDQTIQSYCAAIHIPVPVRAMTQLEPGHALVWHKDKEEMPYRIRVVPGSAERRRHRRKYAEGELPSDRSFYFRGPSGQLNLRAQNLILFMQLGEGVDDATWLYHLRYHHYSNWMAEAIKDDVLAQAVLHIENQNDLTPRDSRELVRSAIEERYTFPAVGTDSGSH